MTSADRTNLTFFELRADNKSVWCTHGAWEGYIFRDKGSKVSLWHDKKLANGYIATYDEMIILTAEEYKECYAAWDIPERFK